MADKHCEKGHVYDAAKHNRCPFCGVSGIEVGATVMQGTTEWQSGAPKVQLRVTEGLDKGRAIELLADKTKFTIGRGFDCDLILTDQLVSGGHASITRTTAGGFILEDKDSRNGTYLGKQRISEPIPVKVGDKITVGNTVFELTFSTGVADSPREGKEEITVVAGVDVGKSILLSGKKVFNIGKQLDSDIYLTDSKVSRVHAQITVRPDGSIQLEDMGSLNGTYVCDKRLSAPIVLNPEQASPMIRLGDSVLKLSRRAPGTQAAHALADGKVYQPMENYTRMVPIAGKVITIGRDPGNDFVLDHPMVSRFHAKVVVAADKHYAEDLGSMHGTFVNQRRIVGRQELPTNSLLEICGFRLYFDGTNLIEYDETSGQVRIELDNLCQTALMPDGSQRKLLQNINITVAPREFVAVLGGSGAGKSTLMGAMSGMRPASSGQVLINGLNLYDSYDSFRSMIGYVPQDDIIHLELTVTEVLTYSARLRMPDDTTEAQIAAAVDEVLSDLELTVHRDKYVKDLSGGQRKRVSIGVELLTKPGLFFLDEPTSGLDPGLEKVMMELLRKLAYQGRTIILITHATFNIHLCDKVIFLAPGGHLAFFGTPTEALQYFGANDFAEIYKQLNETKNSEGVAHDYDRSDIGEKYRRENVAVISSSFRTAQEQGKSKKNTNAGGSIAPRKSAFREWKTITARYACLFARDRRNLMVLLLQAVIIPLIIVMVFHYDDGMFKNSRYSPNDLSVPQLEIVQKDVAGKSIEDINSEQNTKFKPQVEKVLDLTRAEIERGSNMSLCVAMMIFTAIMLGASNSSREIVKEQAIYRRERLVNLRVTSYLLSKVTVLSGVCLVQTLLLVTVVTLGLNLPAFWTNVGAFFLVYIVSMMMGLAVSATVSNTDKAAGAVMLLLIPQIILSGALVPMSKIQPEYLKYFYDLAISKWSYELIGGQICAINSKLVSEKAIIKDLQGDFSANWFILLGFIVLFYLIAAIVMKRKD